MSKNGGKLWNMEYTVYMGLKRRYTTQESIIQFKKTLNYPYAIQWSQMTEIYCMPDFLSHKRRDDESAKTEN